MKIKYVAPLLLFLLSLSCKTTTIEECNPSTSLDAITSRSFALGFTTWNYDITLESMGNTYDYINHHADIYVEQFDDKIPWNALINGTEYPEEFTQLLELKKNNRIASKQLVLSVSLLNSLRSDINIGYDGKVPKYTSLNDQHIIEAYTHYVQMLMETLNPDVVILAMEVNELLHNAPQLWEGYTVLIGKTKKTLKERHPEIQFSESITLHTWLNENLSTTKNEKLNSYIMKLDFVPISFYPFFNGLSQPSEFQEAFDYLHQQVSTPIAFVETGHLAKDLSVPEYSLSIAGSSCEQNAYLETLLLNAYRNNYKFVIWWTHRDFDPLWETFPENIKPMGKLWRNTGLLDVTGEPRLAAYSWDEIRNLKQSE